LPKNKVQFQKGLSLTQFLADFGTEAQCEQALFDARWPQGLSCPHCAGASFCRLRSRRATFQCNHCKRQVSLLAGTIFQATKLPLTTWFLARYCLAQAKHGLSALALGRHLGGNNNTAWLLKHKLMQAMLERDRSYRLQGTVQVDDADWGGELPGGKRGRGWENKTPFLIAVQGTAEGQPEGMQLSVLEGFRKSELERWAQQQRTPGSTVQSDGLACFGGVEAVGCQHRARVTGGGKAACELPELLWVNTILGNVKRSLHGTYHAFAAKYAARYLAEFAYRFNRRYDLTALPERLLHAAALAAPLPRPLVMAGA
jgi:transposase-like protein